MTPSEEQLAYFYELARQSKILYWAQTNFNWVPKGAYQSIMVGCFDELYRYPDDYFDPNYRGKFIRQYAWRSGRQLGKTESLSVGTLYLAICKPVMEMKPALVKENGQWIEKMTQVARGADTIVASRDAHSVEIIFGRVVNTFIKQSKKYSLMLDEGVIDIKLHPFPKITFHSSGWKSPATIIFRGPGDKGQAARGGTYDYKLYDEADYLPNSFWEAELATGINAGENGLRVVSSTPTGRREMFFNVCFEPNAPILTPTNEFKPIQEIKKGEMVINKLGVAEEVVQTFETQYDGKMIEVATILDESSILVTSKHPFFSTKKASRFCHLCRQTVWKCNSKCHVLGWHGGMNLESTKYYPIEELQRGDFLTMPVSLLRDEEKEKVYYDKMFAYVPIKCIKQSKVEKQTVHNLTVGIDHSYTVNRYGVANCTEATLHHLELHFSSKENPNYTKIEDAKQRALLGTDTAYSHEIEADWGVVEEGAFDWNYFAWVFNPHFEKSDGTKIPRYRIFNPIENVGQKKMGPNDYEFIGLSIERLKRIKKSDVASTIVKQLPPRQDNKAYWFGGDFGYTDDPAEFVVFEEYNSVMKMIVRLQLQHIDTMTQCDIIALLDTFYLFKGLGADATGLGRPMVDLLTNKGAGQPKYQNHNFEQRMFPVNFSEAIEIGKQKGKPVKMPAKEHMTHLLNFAAQQKRLIIPGLDVDDEIENQFRNHTYSKNEYGKIIYSKSRVYPDHIVDACRVMMFAKWRSMQPRFSGSWAAGSAFKSRGAGGWA